MNNNFLPYQLKKNSEQANTLATQMAQIASNAKSLGAKGDGTTIDTTNLTNAVQGQTNLLIPDGTYLLDRFVDLPAGAIKISGIPNKTIIKTTSTIYALFRLYKANTNYQDIVIEGITFDGGSAPYNNGQGFGISIYADGGYSASNIIIRNCRFKNIPNSAITINTSNRVIIENNIFENCTSGSSGNQVISVYGGTDVLIKGNRVVNCQGVGIATTNCNGVRVSNNYIDSCTGNNGIQSLNDTNYKAIGNTSSNSGFNGLEVDGTQYFSLVGNTFNNNNYHGLTITSDGSNNQPKDGEVVGNTFYNNKFTGMNVIGGKNITVSANRSSANNQANNASWQYGILVQKNSTKTISASDIVVTGNISHGDANQKYGFGITDDTTNCIVTNNNFSNNGGIGNINNTATGTNTLANNEITTQSIIYVESFPRLSGETDDQPRIVRACNSAPEFAEIVFDPHVSYTIVGSVTNTKSLNLNLNGASFTIDPSTDIDAGTGHQVKGNPTFYFKGTIGTAYSIQTANEMAISVTMTTSTDASNFSVGDYVIIEDQSNIQKWDNSAVGSVGYGEINVVSSISGGVITLSKPVEFNYSTTPTIKKMTPLINPKVYGGAYITEIDPGFSYTGGGLTGYAPHPIHFEYCVKPEVNDCNFDKWQLHATNFHYCVAPNMRNVTGKNPFRTADAGSGYFMRFERCWGGKVEKCVSRKVRHMVDWVMSFDSVSDNNLAIEPQNIAIYTHGNSSKRCSSINDVVQGGTQQGFGIGNPSFAGDYDFTFINPTYHGNNVGIVIQCTAQRIKIVNPSIYTSGTDGILISSGAGEVQCMGGIIYQYGNSGSASRSIMVRPQLSYGDTTGVSTGKVIFIGTKLRGGGIINLRDDCSFNFINPDININNPTANVLSHSLIQAGVFPIDIVVKDGEIKGTFAEAFDITNAPTGRYEIDNMYVKGYTSRGTNMIGASNLRFTNNDFPDPTPYNIYGANAPLASYQGNNPNTNWENSIHSVVGVNVAVSASATTLAVTGLTQYDTKYSVSVSPAWNTTYWITGKSTSGFTINFGTAPVSATTLDWSIKR